MVELRQRVTISFVAVVLCSSVAYGFAKPISHFFMDPLFLAYPELTTLVYTNLTEAFFSYLKLSILVGIIGSVPILAYQTWMYVAPGLKKKEKRAVLRVVAMGTLLFCAGALFSFFVVLPELLKFLMSFIRDNLTPMPKFGAYLTFVARIALGFGLAFEIPFLMVAAVKFGLVPKRHFHQKRLFFYLIIFVLSFLLTAGEPVSTVLVAMPLCVLYEAGALIGRLF
nr:twin-arginine translocase subunit TatC [Desulfobulbaceae bacterium]